MKNNLLVLFVFLSIFNQSGFSIEKLKTNTNEGWCGSSAPDLKWESNLQRLIQRNTQSRNTQTTYNIPVIVHIIYQSNTTSQNISKAQVDSQLAILNRDYAGIGLNTGSLPAPFKALIGNAGVHFCEAKIAPNGTLLAEPGLERIKSSTKGFENVPAAGYGKDYIDATIKPATIWDPNYYLNVWVVKEISITSGSRILGYAVFPTMTGLTGLPETSTETTDGFVCVADYYGNTGAAAGTLGRTATHEIGHWLGLRHISGDAVCGDDFVADTPPQKGGNAGGPTGSGLNYGCPTYPFQVNGCGAGTSPNGELFQDFMDYTDDNCMALFTNGQATRMQTALVNGDYRKNVINSPVCDTVIPAPVAAFTSTLGASTLCAASKTYSFTDKSLFKPASWSWSFQGGAPATSTSQNPTGIVFNTAGLHDVTLTVTSPRGTTSITKQINVSLIGTATMPLQENFEGALFPPLGWNLVNRNGNPAVNWDVRDGYSGYGIGTRSMIYDNTTLDGAHAKDDIVSPKVDLTGITTAKLKFDVAYAPFLDTANLLGTGGTAANPAYLFDTLQVLLTSDCETNATNIYTKGGFALATYPAGKADEFYPTPAQWRTDSIAIPAAFQNKANVQVIFRNLGNYGHTIYVDNINLATPNSTPTATAGFTVSDTVVCAGGSLTFTNTSTASSGSPDSVRWTIPGGVPGTSASTTTVSPVFSTSGSYVISLVAYKSGNASAVFTKSIRVKSNPSVSVSSPTICSGNTAQPVASGATTYAWTGGLTAVSNPTTPVLTTTTTYTVTGTTAGCTGTAVSTVTVNPTPSTGVNSPTICSGTTATLTGTGATSYTWSGGLAAGNPATTPVLTTTTTYTVTGTTGSCSSTAVATVTVTALPNVGVNSPTICSGTTATLTGTGATSYTWSGGLAAGNPATTPVLTTTTTYTVTGTTGICSKTAVSTVTVTAPPSVTVNSPTICSGTTATLTANGATNYTWTGGLTGNPATTPVLTTTTTYTVTGSNGSCSGTAIATVTVNAAPGVGVNSPTICAGTTATLTGTGATSYTWSGGLAAGNPVTTPTLTTTTTYTVTGTTGICSATAVATVTVTPLPNVTVNSPGICSGQTATLTANGASSYTWTGGLSGNPATTPALTTTTTYTVTGTTGSCSKTAVATVSVSSTLNVTVNSPTICAGQTATLTGNGASSYTWTGGLSGNPATTPALTTTTTYTVTGSSGSCSNTAIATVSVTSLPSVTVNSPGICAGQTAILTGNGASAYTWTGGLTGNPATTPVLTTTTTYTVTGTTGSCSATAVATVSVTSLPSVTVNSPVICSGETATLTGNGASTYIWTGGLTGNPATTPALSATTTYTVTGSTGSCSGTAVATVTVNSTPVTPGITQSGDTLYSSTIIAGAGYEWYKGSTLVSTSSVPYYKLTSSGSYTVKVVNGSCTSAESAAFPAVYTGVKNATNSVKVFEVYPNPTEGRLVMNLNLTKSADVHISIYTPEGRELYVKSFGNTRNVFEELNINDYAKGVYIIKLTVDDETYYHKVVKE